MKRTPRITRCFPDEPRGGAPYQLSQTKLQVCRIWSGEACTARRTDRTNARQSAPETPMSAPRHARAAQPDHSFVLSFVWGGCLTRASFGREGSQLWEMMDDMVCRNNSSLRACVRIVCDGSSANSAGSRTLISVNIVNGRLRTLHGSQLCRKKRLSKVRLPAHSIQTALQGTERVKPRPGATLGMQSFMSVTGTTIFSHIWYPVLLSITLGQERPGRVHRVHQEADVGTR